MSIIMTALIINVIVFGISVGHYIYAFRYPTPMEKNMAALVESVNKSKAFADKLNLPKDVKEYYDSSLDGALSVANLLPLNVKANIAMNEMMMLLSFINAGILSLAVVKQRNINKLSTLTIQ